MHPVQAFSYQHTLTRELILDCSDERMRYQGGGGTEESSQRSHNAPIGTCPSESHSIRADGMRFPGLLRTLFVVCPWRSRRQVIPQCLNDEILDLHVIVYGSMLHFPL